MKPLAVSMTAGRLMAYLCSDSHDLAGGGGVVGGTVKGVNPSSSSLLEQRLDPESAALLFGVTVQHKQI